MAKQRGLSSRMRQISLPNESKTGMIGEVEPPGVFVSSKAVTLALPPLKTVGRQVFVGGLRTTKLCARMQRLIEEIYPEVDCDAPKVVLGRGRTYERLLLDLNDRSARKLRPERLRVARERLYKAEYRRARCSLTNAGSAKAENVRIRISEGFAPRARSRTDNAAAAGSNDAFFLRAGTGTYRLFETARGDYDPHPSLEFDVDWDRADLADSSVISWLFIVLLAAFVLVVINDVAAALRVKRDEERGGAAPKS